MLKDELIGEIERWTEKLDGRLSRLEYTDESGEDILKNAKAYREDSEHFFENEKYIESFESLIWSWAFLEIGEDLGHLSLSEKE